MGEKMETTWIFCI